MRVSTNMIFARGIAQMQMQTGNLLHTQQQLSTRRRILTPSDDPIGAARALDLTQSRAINQQYRANQGNAEDHLNLLENRLVGVQEAMQYIRTRVVQAGNATLNEQDLKSIATDLRVQYDAIVALANSHDANNEYLFGGFKTQSPPFEGGFGNVHYTGDQGERSIQVSATRFMPITAPGSEIFSRTQPVSDKLIKLQPDIHNTGNGELAVTIADAFRRGDESYLGRRLDIQLTATGYNIAEIIPGVPGSTLIATDLPDLAVLGQPELPPGTPNPLYRAVDVSLASGTPNVGDRFEVYIGSTDVFRNLEVFIDSLERDKTGPGVIPGESGVAVDFALGMLDAALENVLRVRSQIGSQMVELENLGLVGSDLDIQYATTLSRLQDVDYAEAISRLTQQQTYLQAAQQSFMRISGLSLFNYLN